MLITSLLSRTMPELENLDWVRFIRSVSPHSQPAEHSFVPPKADSYILGLSPRWLPPTLEATNTSSLSISTVGSDWSSCLKEPSSSASVPMRPDPGIFTPTGASTAVEEGSIPIQYNDGGMRNGVKTPGTRRRLGSLVAGDTCWSPLLRVILHSSGHGK